jgi:hypothetical protein
MLKTDHSKPQLTVKVDGMPAVCTGFACDYEFEVPEGLITGFTMSGQTAIITGTNLPLEPTSVRVANTDCTVTQITDALIMCNLVTPMVAGKWLPAVRDSQGLIPVSVDVPNHVEPLVVSTFSPLTLNVAGNELITVFGSGFPSNLVDVQEFSLAFADGTPCVVEETSGTGCKCRTGKFSKEWTDEVLAASRNTGAGGRRELQLFTFDMGLLASITTANLDFINAT